MASQAKNTFEIPKWFVKNRFFLYEEFKDFFFKGWKTNSWSTFRCRQRWKIDTGLFQILVFFLFLGIVFTL